MQQQGTIYLWLGRHLSEGTGLWVYARAVLPPLLHEIKQAGFKVIVIGSGPPALKKDLERICSGEAHVKLTWRGQGLFSRRLSGVIDIFSLRSYFKSQSDQKRLFHGISNTIPLGLKATDLKSMPVVVTLHDLLQPYPSSVSTSPYKLLKERFYQWYYKKMVTSVGLIFTGHEKTEQLIKQKYLSVPAVKVIYPPLYEKYFAAPFIEQKDNYLLTFISRDPRKNFGATLDAFKKVAVNIDTKLVVVAGYDKAVPVLRKLISGAPWNDRIYIVLKPRLERLIKLYDNARGTIFASLGEGFGYPIYESLARGTPVLTSDGLLAAPFIKASSMVIKCDPRSVDSIASGIDSLLKLEFGDKAVLSAIRGEIKGLLSPSVAAKGVMEGYRDLIK